MTVPKARTPLVWAFGTPGSGVKAAPTAARAGTGGEEQHGGEGRRAC
ncbi:hypothetical protein [Streptomyces sp. NPDC092307]